MKKFKFLACILTFAFVCLAAMSCTVPTPNPGQYTPGITVPEGTLVLNTGDKLEPLAGVSAINASGEDMLAHVQVSHMIPVDGDGCVTTSGSYKIKYVLDLDGDKYNAYRDVEVKFVAPITDDLVINGDFESGSKDPFTKSEFDNGVAGMTVVEDASGNKELCFDVTGVSWQAASPRLETNVFALTTGQKYKVSFTARAEEAKTILVQVGQLLSGDPWFYGLLDTKCALTTENATYSFVFLAEHAQADLSQIKLLFGCGTVDGAAIATKVYFDNIKVEETDEALPDPTPTPEPDYVADGNFFGSPSAIKNEGEGVSKTDPNNFYVWYVQDAGWDCGPATNVTYSLENGVVTLNSNLNETNWWFAVQLFYTTLAFREAGSHTLTFTLNSTVAGEITVNGVKTSIVAGDNTISVPFTVAEKSAFTLSIQLGWQETLEDGSTASHQLLGAATLTFDAFSIDGQAYVPGTSGTDEPEPEPSVQPTEDGNYFNPTKVFTGSAASEDNSKSNPGQINVFFNDQHWEGAGTTGSATWQDNVLSVVVDSQANVYWSTQIFYTFSGLTAGEYTISFVLNSPAAFDGLFNGQSFAIQAGENTISYNLTVTDSITMILCFGESGKVICQPGSYTLSNVSIKAASSGSNGQDQPAEGTFTIIPEGNNPTKIEGAGIWLFARASEIGLTGENWAQLSVKSYEVVMKDPAGNVQNVSIDEKFCSDYVGDAFRIFAVLSMAPGADWTTDVTVTISLAGVDYTATASFVGSTWVNPAA